MTIPPPTAGPDRPPPRRRHRLGRRAVLAAALVLVGGTGVAVNLATRSTTASTLLPASAAPPIAGPTATGARYNLTAEEGHWVLVNFFASWCTNCRRELTQLTALQQRHPDGLRIVSIDGVDDSLSTAEHLIRAARGSWPLVDDPSATAAYEIVGLPESFLLDPHGDIVDRFLGPLTDTAVTRRIG